MKAWSRSYLKGDGLRRALSNKAPLVDGFDPPGQMVQDFANMMQHGGTFNNKWVFNAEALADISPGRFTKEQIEKDAHLTAENIAIVKKEIADDIVELMINNPAIEQATRRALQQTNLTKREWRDTLTKSGIDGQSFRDKLIAEFIEIDIYSELIKT